MMNRALFYKELQEGLNTIFGRSYKRHPEIWRELFEVVTSVKAFEEEVMSIGFGLAPVKSEGSGVDYDDGADSYVARYEHVTIALAFAITEEAEEDGLYGSLGARYAKALANSLQETKNVRGHAVINNGHSASFLGGDGVSLFSTAHPLFGGGTLSNKLATPAVLSDASLEVATNQIGLWTDDRGLPRPHNHLMTDGILLIDKPADITSHDVVARHGIGCDVDPRRIPVSPGHGRQRQELDQRNEPVPRRHGGLAVPDGHRPVDDPHGLRRRPEALRAQENLARHGRRF